MYKKLQIDLKSFLKRKILLLVLLSCGFVPRANALLNTYSFTASTGTVDPMSTGTTSLIAAAQDNVASAVANIGFTFTLNAVAYTQFSVSSNGLMRLGATVVGSTSTNSLITGTDFPHITAYWDNLSTTGGAVVYKVIGTAPNRTLIVDWKVTIQTPATAGANFQVWLSETSNNIQFVYGTNMVANAGGYSVGIAGSTTALDYVSITTSTATASSATVNNSNTTAITSGTSYRLAIPPGCTTSPSPAASATNVSLTPTLSWTAGSGYNNGYDVYFGTAASPPRVSYKQSGTTYLPGTLLANTIYFWKIVARNDSAQAASCATIQFTTAVAPGCPNYVSPAASATNVSVTPTLSWTAGTGTTTGYDVYFGTAASPPLVSTNQVGTTYTPPTLTANTVYFWKVIPTNQGAQPASCTTIQFTTAIAPGCPNYVSPAASAINVVLTPTLSWTAGTGSTTGYDVYFGTAASPPLVSTNQAGTTYTPPTLTAGTVYFWSVIPNNNGAKPASCTIIQFTTASAPGCPNYVSPTASSTNISLTPTLSWTAGAGTTSGYDVYFGTAASPPLVSTNQVGTTYTTPTLTANTVYFWKVIPNNNGVKPASCTTIQFTTLAAPGCPNYVSPASLATNVSLTPTLSWTAGTGITTGYDVYFGTAASPPLVSTNQAGTTYAPPALNANTVYFWKVIPNNSGVSPASCTTIQFTTAVAPGCPNYVSPASLAINVSLNPTLSWTVGTGTTTGYDVYFGTAASPPLVSTNQAGTTYIPATLTAGTVYFWKVIPNNNGAKPASCTTIQFTTASAPGCPNYVSPAASATNVTVTPTLSWTAGTGTTSGYDVYFGTAANPPLVSTNQAGTSYTPPALTENTVYFWKVIPNNNGVQAASCTIIQFTTAVAPGCANYVSPAASSTNISLSPTLSWTAGTGSTTGYDVYFGTAASPPLVSTNQVGTTYTPPTLTANTVYFWKVIPNNNGAKPASCTTIQFTTLAAPGCATYVSPVASATNVSLTPTLSWTAGSGITTGYNVYFGTAASPPLVSTNQAGTTYSPPALTANTVYFWKVIPTNNGQSPASCTTIQFTTIAAPGCPNYVSPASLATNVTLTPTLTWTAGTGTTTDYDVYFGTAASPPLVSTNQAGTSYTPAALNANTVYFWKVIPKNSGQSPASCSTIQFTTAVAPGCPNYVSPAASATNISLTPTLSWTTGTGTTTGYDVYFGTAASPPLVSTNQVGTTYTPPTLTANTVYFWKVIPSNQGAKPASCTTIQFTTAVAPGCPNYVSPAASATNVTVTPTLSWTAGTGTTTGYDVYFGTAASPPLVSSNQSGTTYIPPALTGNTVYFWKVIPINNGAKPASCTTIQFTTAAAPGCVNYVSPAASATNITLTPTLTWTAGTGTTNGYDVYFGTAASPPLVSTNQAGTTYTPPALTANTVYFWKVVPSNNGAKPTTCTTIQFTTKAAPGCVINQSPAASALGVLPNASLTWAAGTGITTGYDVYFGTAASPPLVSTNQVGTTYTPPTAMTANTVYYWKVVPQNSGLFAAGCATISFTTAALNYNVTRSTNVTFNSIFSTGTSIPGWHNSTNTDDNLSNPTPIGFNFNYSGNTYSSFLVSTNGFLTFNTGSAATGQGISPYGYSNSSLSDGVAPTSPLTLAPFWDDIYCQGNGGTQLLLDNSIKYEVSGIAPNRILTLEWVNFEAFNSSGTDFNFQVKLYETTNEIEFIYGNMQGFDGLSNLNYSYSCGLNAATISTPPTAGQVLNQLTAATRNFGLTPSFQLNKIPECNSKIRFTPGTYTPYVPPASLAPSNDNKVNAIALSVNPSPCVSICGTIYSSANATNSGVAVCSSAGSTLADDDVWFSFVAANSITQIKVIGSGNYDPTLELFNNSNTLLSCANNFGTGGIETINTTTLTIGQTYFVRVYNKGASWGSNSSGDFSICISAPPVPPVNDECSTSILLPVAAIANFVAGTSTLGATASAGIPVCSVAGTFPDDDVWYKFTAINTTETIILNSNTGFNGVIELFRGTCGSFTPINCVNFWGNGIQETLTATGLMLDSTYYFRVYHATAGPGSGSFSVAVTSPTPSCSQLLLPPTGDTGVTLDGISLLWEPVQGATSYKVLFDIVNPPVNVFTITTDTFVNTGLLKSFKNYYWAVLPGNGAGFNTTCQSNTFLTELRNNGLVVRAFIEGLYNSTTGTMAPFINPADTIADSLYIKLITPDTVQEFNIKTAISINGYATIWLPGSVVNSDYYIVVKHRNSLETWSRLILYAGEDTTYNFTDTLSKAYGNNMKLVNGVYVIYTGDVNQDYGIDANDINSLGILARQFETIYSDGDINFDYYTESTDLSILENKLPLNLHRITPFGP